MRQTNWNFLQRQGLKSRVTLLVLLPLFILSGVLGYLLINTHYENNRLATSQKGQQLSRQLSELGGYSLLVPGSDRGKELLSEFTADPAVKWAAFIDDQYNIISASYNFDPTEFQSAVSAHAQHIEQSNIFFSRIFHLAPDDEARSFPDNLLDEGWTIVSLSTSYIASKQKEKVEFTLMVIFTVILFGTLIAAYLVRYITSPIQKLTNAFEKIHNGELQTRIQENSFGELGKLESGFNEMAGAIEKSTEVMEEQVSVATKDLKYVVQELEDRNWNLHQARLDALQARDEKAEFLARMSHEIRTPLNAVIGFSEMLNNYPEAEDNLEKINIINSAANQLLNLVDDILVFTRLDTDKLEIENRPINLLTTLESAVSMLSQSANQKHLELCLLIHNDVPEWIYGDPARLTQIITNLVNNAIKFTAKGHVFIETELIEDNAQSRIRFSISDTGIGITEEQKDKLFKPFSQGDISITRRFGGSGLGLAISQHLIELMGGTIKVNSEPGKGSEFIFEIGNVAFPEAKPTILQGLEQKHILLWDPNPFSLRSIRTVLLGWGIQITNVSSFKETRKLLDQSEKPNTFQYDMLLMGFTSNEISLNVFDDIYQTIRKRYERPILCLVNDNHWQPPESTFGDENFSWLAKPVRRQSLYRRLSKLLKTVTIEQDTETKNTKQHPREHDISILTVDDQEINRLLIRKILASRGMVIDEADSGQTAIEKIKQHTYDLIFMDIHMPNMDGIETTAIIRETLKENTPPIISLSADVYIDDTEKLFNDAVLKPVKEWKLLEAISQWIPDQQQNTSQAPTATNLHLDKKILSEINHLNTKLLQYSVHQQMSKFAETAHKLRGVAGLFEIKALSTLIKELELLAKNNEAERVKAKLPSLISIIDELNARDIQ